MSAQSITKPNGVFAYGIAGLVGAGGSVTKDLFGQLDASFNVLGGNPPNTVVEARFQVDALGAATSNAGRIRLVVNKTVVAGVITALTVAVHNDSPGAGDTITGTLFVEVYN